MDIHPSAIVGKNTILGKNVHVGPFCVLEDHVKIGDNTVIENNVRVGAWTTIGSNCRFMSYAAVGTIPQDLKFKGEKTELHIGNGNTFREFVTVNRGTAHGGGITRIGDNNFFMAYSHIAHDCQIGSGVIFGNAVTLAGHVDIEDHANVGAFSGVHQFCRVGKHSFIGGYSVVTKDPIPYAKVVGNRARMFGMNYIGMKRRHFSEEKIRDIKEIFRFLFQSKLNTTQAVTQLFRKFPDNEDCIYIINFIQNSKRGIIK